ncbi:alpha/beta family hydrolase [Methylocystis sp. 9N]|uniref:Alpha/beta family hydrolase n=1 Tax=Methylocystis borbori TaxID=3118750 RepID=A0ABU7XFK8_9HYPH
MTTNAIMASDVAIGPLGLEGALYRPQRPKGLIIFAHGSGSSRFSPRNKYVAARLVDGGFACLLFDLLTAQEAEDRRNVFDIPLLGARVKEAIDWAGESELRSLQIGLFGASTGAAAALVAAADDEGGRVAAVVSRGGRPDLAGEALRRVKAPTLLIVGGFDDEVIELNRDAQRLLQCKTRLDIVPGATHLFEEPGTLERVVERAADWFIEYVSRGGDQSALGA